MLSATTACTRGSSAATSWLMPEPYESPRKPTLPIELGTARLGDQVVERLDAVRDVLLAGHLDLAAGLAEAARV